MSKPVRWLLVCTHVPEDGGGGGIVRYTVELARALDRHPDVQLTLLCTGRAAPFLSGLVNESTVVPVRGMPTLLMSIVERHAWRALHRGGAHDVVHTVKHLVPARARGLRVLTVHDMLPFDRPGDFGLLKRWLLRKPYRDSLRTAELLITNSRATFERVVRELPYLAERSDVVPLAVSSDLLNSEPVAVPALAGRRFALAVGDASKRKNLALLIDNWDRVVASTPGAVLALAGPPTWGTSAVGDAFVGLAAAGHVEPLGRVSDSQLRWCYENAAVVLCPSLLEGFGLPAIEALAFGAPLITSRDAALREASDGRAVHLDTDDPAVWVTAISDSLGRERPATGSHPVRTWDDVAEETVGAVRRRLGG